MDHFFLDHLSVYWVPEESLPIPWAQSLNIICKNCWKYIYWDPWVTNCGFWFTRILHYFPLSSVLRLSSVRHRHAIPTFLDNLMVSTLETVYFLNAYHLSWSSWSPWPRPPGPPSSRFTWTTHLNHLDHPDHPITLTGTPGTPLRPRQRRSPGSPGQPGQPSTAQ